MVRRLHENNSDEAESSIRVHTERVKVSYLFRVILNRYQAGWKCWSSGDTVENGGTKAAVAAGKGGLYTPRFQRTKRKPRMNLLWEHICSLPKINVSNLSMYLKYLYIGLSGKSRSLYEVHELACHHSVNPVIHIAQYIQSSLTTDVGDDFSALHCKGQGLT